MRLVYVYYWEGNLPDLWFPIARCQSYVNFFEKVSSGRVVNDAVFESLNLLLNAVEQTCVCLNIRVRL